MATEERLLAALEWAQAQVGKPYVLGSFGDSFDCSTYMSGIATFIRDGKASRWFTTHPFHGGAHSPLPGWERDLEAPFMIGITDDGIGHTGGSFLGYEFEATPPKVRSGDAARGARDPMYKWVYGFRPSMLDSAPGWQDYTVKTGDTLTGIASTFKTTVDILADKNGMVDVGAQLEVTAPKPPGGGTVPVTYVAKAGDSWSSIAQAHSITVDKLLELNGIKVATGSSYIVGHTDKPVTPGRISTDKVLFTGKDDPSIQGSGKDFCAEVVRKALLAIGLPVTDAWVNGYLTIASRESAYNAPQWRVNTTDSNAIGAIVSDGNPFQCSRGAWQCIPQTFAMYHQAGTSLSIYDPVANCAASINYVRAVYKVSDNGSDLASKVQQADPSRPPRGY